MTERDDFVVVREGLDHLYHAGAAPSEWLAQALAALRRIEQHVEELEREEQNWRMTAGAEADGLDMWRIRVEKSEAERDALMETVRQADHEIAHNAGSGSAQRILRAALTADTSSITVRDLNEARAALGGSDA